MDALQSLMDRCRDDFEFIGNMRAVEKAQGVLRALHLDGFTLEELEDFSRAITYVLKHLKAAAETKAQWQQEKFIKAASKSPFILQADRPDRQRFFEE